MDGVHDLGGMHGFGPVRTGADEPVFHADWERRVLAVTLATGALGRWSIDRSRFTREQLPPATYLTSSYYEIWLRGLERLLVQARLLTPEDLCAEARAELDAAVADDDEVADDAAAAASTDGADAATTVDVASTAAADPVGSVGPNGTAARDGQPAGSGRSAPAAAVTWPALRAGLRRGRRTPDRWPATRRSRWATACGPPPITRRGTRGCRGTPAASSASSSRSAARTCWPTTTRCRRAPRRPARPTGCTRCASRAASCGAPTPIPRRA